MTARSPSDNPKERTHLQMKDTIKAIRFRRIAALLCCGAVLLAAAIIGMCLPDRELPAAGYVAPPEFSAGSGFYEESFRLQLSSAPGTRIYYTLDCTDPEEDGLLYEAPILVENVTGRENIHSMRTDVSAGFYEDLILEHQTKDAVPHYQAPDYPVEKCMVVRAMAVDSLGNRSQTVTCSYFVGTDPAQWDGCNIISVVTDPDNLFDPGSGIYVTGDIFDAYMTKKTPHDHWRFWDANYRQTGAAWERPGDFTLFDSSGAPLLDFSGSIRTQGGVSRGTLPRSLNLYADTSFAGGLLNDRLFADGYVPTRITLSGGGNQIITQFNDYMMTCRTQDLNVAKMPFSPYVLFLDGEYWGFYWLTGSYDARYLSAHYGVAEEDVVMIKNGALEVGGSSDVLLYDNMKTFITENDMSVPANYAEACRLIDLDSFLDYYACMAYIARCEDWPTTNYALWRTKQTGDGPYADGKWRWMLFDCNSTSMYDAVLEHDTLSYIIRWDPIFAALWENSQFREDFQSRILEIADQCFDAGQMLDFIDAYEEEMEPILAKSWQRFYGKENDKLCVFQSKMEGHRIFFTGRRAVVESWFA